MSNFFYVVYPSNPELRNILNTLKVIADEDQRTEAHITIRGPYQKKRPNISDVNRWSSTIEGEQVQVNKVDNFFAYNQNTVFFSCGDNRMLKKIWKKFTYNEFRPHITIYNGPDRKYSFKVFETLAESFKPFLYKINELSRLQPKDEIQFNRLVREVDLQFTKEILMKELAEVDFNNITNKRRIEYLRLVSKYLYETFEAITIA